MDEELQETLENAAIFGAIERGKQHQRQAAPKGPPCPKCGGLIPMRGATICMHCRSELKGNEHAIYEAKIKKATEQWKSDARADARKDLKRLLIIFGPLIAIGILIMWISTFFRG